MNRVFQVICLNFRSLLWNRSRVLILQAFLAVLAIFIMTLFSYNFDWQRWIAMLALVALIKLWVEFSLCWLNYRKNESYTLRDLTQISGIDDNRIKHASRQLGYHMILVGLSLFVISYGTFRFFEYQIDVNSATVKAYKEDMYWRTTANKNRAGFYMEYVYRVNGKKYQNRTRIGRKSNISNFQVQYLPLFPNVHRLTFDR